MKRNRVYYIKEAKDASRSILPAEPFSDFASELEKIFSLNFKKLLWDFYA